MGMPVSVLRSVLTYREFNMWLSYFKNKQPDETEIQLATIALIISQGLGNKKAKFTDFLVNQRPVQKESKVQVTEKLGDTNHNIMTADAVRAVFGGIAVKGK